MSDELARIPHYYAAGWRGECGRCGARREHPVHLDPADREASRAASDLTFARAQRIMRRRPTRAELDADRRRWP